MSGLDWFPTFVAAAGNANIVDELKKGKKIGDRTYKNHLDGYNQLNMITGKGASNRHEIFYRLIGIERRHRRADFRGERPRIGRGSDGDGEIATDRRGKWHVRRRPFGATGQRRAPR